MRVAQDLTPTPIARALMTVLWPCLFYNFLGRRCAIFTRSMRISAAEALLTRDGSQPTARRNEIMYPMVCIGTQTTDRIES